MAQFMHMTAEGMALRGSAPKPAAEDQVKVVESGGEVVLFSTEEALGGTTFEVSKRGVLTLSLQWKATDPPLRVYSPTGWRSVEAVRPHSTDESSPVVVYR